MKGDEIVIEMLKFIGEDVTREGLVNTPNRVIKMWKEIYRGYDESRKPNVTVFRNGRDGIIYDQMICDEGDFYSYCEHHMIPFFGKYYFAYIPNPKGWLLGLSKVGRIVDYYSAKLQIQERLGHQIVNELWSTLQIPNAVGDRPGPNKKYAPLAMGLVLEGEHLCKTMRGSKKKGKMRTTILKGTIKKEPAARAEFLDWVNKNGKR